MFKTTCPKCGETNFGPTIDSVCGGANHGPGCYFYYRGVQTKFNAIEIPDEAVPKGAFINKDPWERT